MAARSPERQVLVRNAAWHIWSFLAREAQEPNAKGFIPAKIIFAPSRPPAWHDGPGGLEGWRWDGVLGVVMEAFWPELATLKVSPNLPPNNDEKQAHLFRRELGGYLKWSRNLICIVRGSPRTRPPKPNQWFIRGTWSDHMPSRWDVDDIDHDYHLENRVTPAQAGETRTPAPVDTAYLCRIPGCRHTKPFSTAGNRNQHERNMHPDEVKLYVDGEYCQFCNDGPFALTRSRTVHEKSCPDRPKGEAPAAEPARQKIPEPAPRPTPRLDHLIRHPSGILPSGPPSGALAKMKAVIEERDALRIRVAELEAALAAWEEIGQQFELGIG